MEKLYLLKEVLNMITFLLLCLILLVIFIISAIILAIGGSVFMLLFGDLIMCVLIIVWLVKRARRKK